MDTFTTMPRYLVERTFPDRFTVPPGSEGHRVLMSIIACNTDRNVTWIHSYVSVDGSKMLCVYDAPSPEAIRRTAYSNQLPVDRITEILVLDPYAYHVG